MIFRFLVIFLGFSFLPLVSAQAEGSGAAPDTAKAVVKPDESTLSPEDQAKQEALTAKVSGIMKGLDINQIQHFTAIYANYMVLSLVNNVEKEVSGAINGCAGSNGSMESDLKARLETWQGALAGPRKDSLNNINSMVAAQDYLPKSGFDDLFSLVDDVRAITSGQDKKEPVTTPEACKYMLSKMDETQKNMIQLLGSTLITYPNVLQKTQE